MTLVFFYPQFKKLTGAERLILKLSDFASREPGADSVVLLTHRFAEECKPALGENVQLVETRWPLQLTGNHYLDAAVEYALGPALLLKVSLQDVEGIVFFGPPSVPAMWVARRLYFPLHRTRVPVLYFCFEPPRFIYSDTGDIVARLGRTGRLLRPLFTLYRSLDRRMVRSAHRLLANSPYGARKLWDAYRRPATVLEHGVDFATPGEHDVQAVRRRYALGNRPVAITVNHLHPRKRIDLFLRAFAQALEHAPDSVALVVGEGPERSALEGLAAELGQSLGQNVIFAGSVAEEELPAHYAAGNVYVHTGREESFGLSVIEALYSGVPVVSVNEGGPCDTVEHGVSGYLVDANAQSLGGAISALLNDLPRAEAMGSRGAQSVRRRFRWENGARTLLSVLRTIEARLQQGSRENAAS